MGLLDVLIIPAIVGPIVLGLLSRTRTWAVVVQAVLAVALVLLGGSLCLEPYRWVKNLPDNIPGGLLPYMQSFGTQIGGVLLILWAVAWLFASLIRRALGTKGPRTPAPPQA